MKELTSSVEVPSICRAQGSINRLTAILTMSSEIRSYLHDVATGKRKKLQPEVKTNA